jgi:hypothetical protein
MSLGKKNVVTVIALIAGIIASSQTHAFTSQLPVSGYRFLGPLNITNAEVGTVASVYTVPNGRIAVITDVYIALSPGADGTHTTTIANTALELKAGPFVSTSSEPFSKGYTSGIIFISGQQIVASDIGGTGDVTINLVGYEVCAEPCSDLGAPTFTLPPFLLLPPDVILPPGIVLPPDVIAP